jgi:hypothetical protein
MQGKMRNSYTGSIRKPQGYGEIHRWEDNIEVGTGLN